MSKMVAFIPVDPEVSLRQLGIKLRCEHHEKGRRCQITAAVWLLTGEEFNALCQKHWEAYLKGFPQKTGEV